MRSVIPGLLISLVALTGAASGQTVPPFTPLGTPGGTGGSSVVRAISPDGSIVHGSASDGTTRDGFRWTRAGGRVSLGLGDLGTNGGVWGASLDGRTVVGFRQLDGAPAAAFVAVDGVATALPVIPGYTDPQTNAYGVSGDGAVVAGMQSGIPANGPGSLQAVRWAGGAATPLGAVGDGQVDLSTAYNISRDGSVIVGVLQLTGSTDRAFRWTQASGMQVLGLATGFTHAAATGISADNSTVIGSVLRDTGDGGSPDEYEAVRFVGGNVELLGDLPGGPLFSVAQAVSADGSVVVGRSAVGGTAPRGDDRAFIWDAEHGMRDLAGVLTELGADLTGWTLTAARAVSDDGRTIAGDAIDPAGRVEAFVAVVPEPAIIGGLGVVALGGGLLRRGRRG